jgi:hypothetical protein
VENKLDQCVMSTRVTVREVLRLLWEADSYPRPGNEDWAIAARMEAAAMEKAATAVPSPDDPRNLRAGWKRCKGAISRSTSAKKYTGRSMTILPTKNRRGPVKHPDIFDLSLHQKRQFASCNGARLSERHHDFNGLILEASSLLS